MADTYEDRVGYWIVKLSKAMDVLRQRKLRPLGLHRGQAAVLWQLRHGDGLSQIELADRLELTRASITSALGRMEDAGWVSRDRDPDDRRLLRVRLTAQGKRLVERLSDVLDEMEEELTFGMKSAAIEQAVEAMRAIHCSLKAAGQEGEPHDEVS